ncbi:hypothetical protein ACG9H2_11310 [Acinetobacter ursingii]|uniref:hypothetical protein n=1 Tax=Acinetobacter ursingii TaxID=108980 RepID=UPI003AF94E2D
MSKLIAYVSSGKHKGTPLYPHKHFNEQYVASPSRFQIDYIYVDSEEELEALVNCGLSARMSNKALQNAPSLIISKNVKREDGSTLSSKPSEFLSKLLNEVELDYDSKTKSRKEQNFLRAHLMNAKIESNCTICGNLFPLDFLIAAHIKPRKDCKQNEKLDFDNIATLMCKMGCDDLYERGYIYIENGIVKKNTKRKTTIYLDQIISTIEGKEIKNWGNSKHYYDFHKNTFLRE